MNAQKVLAQFVFVIALLCDYAANYLEQPEQVSSLHNPFWAIAQVFVNAHWVLQQTFTALIELTEVISLVLQIPLRRLVL